MSRKYLPIAATIIIAAALVIALRWATLQPNSITIYGYDFGFYSHAITHSHLSSSWYFLGMDNPYGNHFFVLINWLRLPQIPTLIVSFYAFQGLAAILMLLSLRKFGKLIACLGVLLFGFSVAQTQMHAMFLWKAAYGQLLLLLIIWLITEKYYKYIIMPAAILLFTHKTTAIVAAMSTSAHMIVSSIKNRQALVVVAISTLTAVGIIFLTIGPDKLNEYFFNPINQNVAAGIFLTFIEYLINSWPVLLFALFALYLQIKNRIGSVWLWLIATTLCWIVFNFPFYNRMVQYFDLAIIYFAAIGISMIPHKTSRYFLSAVLIIVTAFNWLQFQKTLQPQFDETGVREITQFSVDHQGAFVLAASANDAPWLLSYLLGNNRLAAPGLFEDVHSYLEWKDFWEGNNQTEFLNKYPAPLYIYQRSGSLGLKEPSNCLEQTSTNFYLYSCK